MFYKYFDYRAVMVGSNTGAYPYWNTYLQGMEMEFLPDTQNYETYIQNACKYIQEHAEKIDVLVLHGIYGGTLNIGLAYKMMRPNGKIYLSTDLNGGWGDRISWNEPRMMEFLNICDVIGVSCKKIQAYASRKWPAWKIHYIPNGFFNITGIDVMTRPCDKEKIILTVGRIGSKQKANDVLLEAFAMVHHLIPEWKLHLVGEIESSFLSYKEKYFRKNLELQDKVIFKGLIESKEELLAEYKKASIFALTSNFEGGAPNVVAEALTLGCFMITTDVDASQDITDSGRCGKVIDIGDVYGLADAFLAVCKDEELLKESAGKSAAYAKRNFDWELNIKRLNHLLFQTEG